MTDETSRLNGGHNQRVLADRYVLRGPIGTGGMAEVQLADDTVLDRRVAVKMLHGRYADDPSFLDRFRREAQSAASLNHPNIVSVYDTGASDGESYIVMEYVPGRSLRDLMYEEGVSPNRAAEIAADVAEALDYAHERGLVHRDIKPGNILVSEEGQPKVTDFGIARAINAETVTQTAAVFGTAAYVSPEQAQGDAVDRRTDIYSLGCVLYEMLTGSQPFSGESAVTLAYKHVSEPPMPPSRLEADISPELEAVTLRALAKDPAERYQTAADFAADLRRAVSGIAVTAPLDSSGYSTTHYIQREQPPPPPVYEEYWEPEPEPDYERRRGIGAFLVVLLLGVAALAGVLLYDMLAPAGAARVEVPTVEGMTLAEASTELANAGFKTEAEEVPDPNVDENVVIRTEPQGGSTAPEGSTVRIVYSGGPDVATVPDVRGLSEEDAVETLKDAGFSVGARTTETSDTVNEGNVIRTEPSGGSEEPLDTEIDIVVSEGPDVVSLPSVVGEPLDEARTTLNDFCGDPPCVVVVLGDRVYSNTYAKGQVVNQQPAGGSQVQHGASVTLTVSRGSRPDQGNNTGDGGGNNDGGDSGTSTSSSSTNGTQSGSSTGDGTTNSPGSDGSTSDDGTDTARTSDTEGTSSLGEAAERQQQRSTISGGLAPSSADATTPESDTATLNLP